MKKKILIALTMLVLGFSFTVANVGALENQSVGYYNSIEEFEKYGQNEETIYIVPSETNLKDTRSIPSYVKLELTKSNKISNYKVGYHKQHRDWRKVDGYYFSTNKTSKYNISGSFGLNIKPISIGVSVSQASPSSTGFFIKASSKRESRPFVTADISVKVYDVYEYESGTDFLLSIKKDGYIKKDVSNEEITIKYR